MVALCADADATNAASARKRNASAREIGSLASVVIVSIGGWEG